MSWCPVFPTGGVRWISLPTPFPFTFTHYYDAEMGPPIDRFFISFERLVDPAGLARTKQETNGIEDLFRERGEPEGQP